MPPEARFLPRAERDLEDIAAYIAKESGEVAIAARFVQRILSAADRYAEQPLTGSPAPGYKYGVRTFLVGQYIVFYRKKSYGIEVVKVVHGSRRQP